MKYCSNCGAEVNENAAICLRCGYALKKQESTPVQPAQGGKASMVLGIISIVFAAIGFFLTICVQSYLTSTYEGRIQRLATNFDSTKIGLMILFLTVPGILSGPAASRYLSLPATRSSSASIRLCRSRWIYANPSRR